MRQSSAAACLLLSLVIAQPAAADPSVKELAARTELHPIATLTLTDAQFLTGDKNGKATIAPAAGRLGKAAGGRAHAWFGWRRGA
jgi:hypothetical protein